MPLRNILRLKCITRWVTLMGPPTQTKIKITMIRKEGNTYAY